MINKLPIIGWFLSALASVSLAVPFWNCVGLFIVVPIIKGTLVPKLVSVSNDTTVEKSS